MSDRDPTILTAREAGRLEREPLVLTARTVARSLHQGVHRSAGVGGSTEFYDYKQYTQGDSTRFIDWKAFGRSDRLYLKRFEPESRMSVSLFLDTSASMRFASAGEGERTKLERAAEIAASVAYLAGAQGDAVGLNADAPASGWPAFARVIETLRAAIDQTERAPMPESLAAFSTASDLVILLTDALDETDELADAIRRLAGTRGRDIALVQILTRDELELPDAGLARFEDPETGERTVTDTNTSAGAYREAIASHLRETERLIRSVRGVYHLASTSDPPIDAVRAIARRGAR